MPISAANTVIILILPFILALLAPFLFRWIGRAGGYLLLLAPIASFAWLLASVEMIAQGEVLTGAVQWIPSLNVALSWRLDGLSLVFGLLVSGIGAFIILYASAYLAGHKHLGRFMAYLMLFMGAMQGLVLADGFLTLFFVWELTSIASFLLIGFDHERSAARRAALQALIVTALGGLALLAGLLLIAQQTGAASMSELLAMGETLRNAPLYSAILVLILLAAFTKSAQFPFHFWLPNAMEAPTPVSAYLHSATMVKAGVYLLMRLNPVMGDTVLWELALPLFGTVTLIVAAVLALRQSDLKLMLAYTTLGSLGLLVLLVGVGTEAAILAACAYLVAHALFKGALFMVVGAIDVQAGTRDVRRLSGLGRDMRLTFLAALLAGLSMAGIPLLIGFAAKELIYEALIGDRFAPLIRLLLVICGNAAMVVVAVAVGLKPFIGARAESLKAKGKLTPGLILGPLVLGLAGLAAGLMTGVTASNFISPMAGAISGTQTAHDFSSLPHLNLAFALSLLTLALGAGLFWKMAFVRERIDAARHALGWGPDKGFDQLLRGTVRFATKLTRVTQNGQLDTYLMIAFGAVAIALLVPMFIFGELPAMPSKPDLQLHEIAFALILLAGLIGVLRSHNRLTGIVLLGVQGFAIAALFLMMGAPDLAFTQFMIETLSMVILALVMTRIRLLPDDRRNRFQRLRDGAIAIACGAGFGLLILKVTQGAFNGSLTEFFNAHSKLLAHGANVVNVIIVDFRGFDTLGEIAVVSITGLAIVALLRLRPNRRVKQGDAA